MAKLLVIGVDVRDLRVAQTGTKTYLEELCAQFKLLESDELKFQFLDVSIPVYTGKQKLLKWIEHFRYQLWKQLILPVKAWSKGCQVLFCTDNFAPVIHLGYKTIPVFHDAFFFENPEHYGKLWLWLYHQTAIPAGKRAAYIVVPTEYSKKQINRYTQIPPDQLVVIPEGPKSLDKIGADNSSQLLARYNLSSGNYLLHVGAMYKRKNIPALIHAFKLIKTTHPDLKLVLSGSPPSKNLGNDFELIQNAIAETDLQYDVIFTGYLSDTELTGIYQHALLYVFPSINEGFGIPILEAFKYDLPVLVANNTCLPEVGGDAVVTFDPFDIANMAAQINKVLNDAELRSEMIIKGRERLKLFSWKIAAEQLVELFRKAV
ncbi:glycosyltransferase family 4 protein [Mucilaginibacter jinjuensis]|uniref:Glycosyltransferase family 1 protein n=1 Tax=Mucilaginibacter jinjuensis TaxID=1176721 RepID=A0ABY7T490_9SPHI|nr:glycosyltransferase family 1 protein [Mucilaginibacter jinjuensis]WCT10598.1 glycosyltransferase family 1 protein [Mucilaginibacter jinjuensis]